MSDTTPLKNVTLKRVFRSTTNKEGQPLVGKNGKPYERLAIKTTEHGDRWLSGFGNSDNKDWKEGDTVKVMVEEVGQYLNFRTPSRLDLLELRVSVLEDNVGIATGKPTDVRADDVPDDIPWN